ncbi:MAG: putative salt-induced outer membrane protein [Massilia sp.]
MLMKSFKLTALALFGLAHGAALANGGAADDLPVIGSIHTPLTVARPETIPEGTWFTSAELGAIATSGNTTGTSISGKIDARHETADWSNEYIVSGFFKEDEIVDDDGERYRQRSAERWALSAKAAYKLMNEGSRAFVLGSHVSDKFGAYTRYSSFAVGHGSQLYNTDDKALDVEVGPGYFSGKREDGQSENGLTVRGAARFRWQVSPSAAFVQTVSVERGTSNVHSIAESALSTKINDTMQMKAAFSARNDTNVPEDKKNTDTQTSLTLVYSF